MKTTNKTGLSSIASIATLVAFAMIGAQVASKAARDALFLSYYDVTSLPLMLIVGSFASLLTVFLVSRLMAKFGPDHFVPVSFTLSSLLLLGQWVLSFSFPGATALLLYVHVATFGSVLVSGFWSLINEKFDPRSGKQMISRIATGGTLGGLGGGILAERVAAGLSITAMLPILASIHILAAVLLFTVSRKTARETTHVEKETIAGTTKTSARILKEQPYLRSLAALVLLGTVSAALIDYVFKAQASSYYSHESLLRFFAIYYTGIGLLTVVLQGGFSRILLQKLGLVKTVSTLPALTSLSAFGAILFPGLASSTVARSSEAIIKNSLYRSSYELLYTPVPRDEKRSTKSIIDVGFERIGDAIGGGIVKVLLLAPQAAAQNLMLGLAILLGCVSLFVARWLHKGYIRALERSLQNRAVELDISQVEDGTTRDVLQTVVGLQFSPAKQFAAPAANRETRGAGASPATPMTLAQDPIALRLSSLRSGQVDLVQKALLDETLDPLLVPSAIQLLAWDEIARDSIRSLRMIADKATGQLIDSLLDPTQEFSVRRRIPRVLSGVHTQRAADGLLLGMSDRRFEVRFQCSRALAIITQENSSISVPKEKVFEVVQREVHVDRRVWESHRLLDQFDEDDGEVSLFVDGFLRDRVNRSLEQVFTLLSLALPREPLRIAFRGLQTNDSSLRGTSLEYLESILPESIRVELWPFLESKPAQRPKTKTREEILSELLKSNQSIQVSLEEIRKKYRSES